VNKKLKCLYFSKLILYVSLLATGCTSTSTHEYISAVAWSDDNEQIAYILQQYDEKTVYPFSRNNENERYTLKLIGIDGSNNRVVSDNIKGYGTELYYKKEAQYFIIRNQENNKRIEKFNPDTIDYYILDLEGNIIREIKVNEGLSCPYYLSSISPVSIIPSPSGQILAIVSMSVGCQIEATFLDVDDEFAELQNTIIDGSNIANTFWLSDDYFFLNVCTNPKCKANWYLLKLDNTAKFIDKEEFNSLCLQGVLIGDEINSLGEKIVWNNPKEPIQIIKNQDSTSIELKELGLIFRNLDNPENCTLVSEY